MAQSFMAAATTSAVELSSLAPSSIVLLMDLKISLGRRCFITLALKTLQPKSSPAGVSEKFSAGDEGW